MEKKRESRDKRDLEMKPERRWSREQMDEGIPWDQYTELMHEIDRETRKLTQQQEEDRETKPQKDCTQAQRKRQQHQLDLLKHWTQEKTLKPQKQPPFICA